MVIIKHSFPFMVVHGTITIIYIIVIEVSSMHLLCAIYQNQKKGMACLFFFNKFQYQT